MSNQYDEDFEREALKDCVYLEEIKSENEIKFWEWYYSTEGKILRVNEDGSETEVEEILPKYVFPF